MKLFLLLALCLPLGAQPQVSISSANQAATVPLESSNYGTVGVQVAGTWSGTLAFEGSMDCATWVSATGYTMPDPTTGAAVTSTTANGNWLVSTAGLCKFRVRASAFASGTASVVFSLSTAALSRGAATAASVTISTSSPVTVDTGLTQYRFNNSAGAMTFTLPTITSGILGMQICVRNYTTRTGAITLQSPASTFIDNGGVNSSSAGTLVSTGALGDAVCVVATSTTQYVAYPASGAWTLN